MSDNQDDMQYMYNFMNEYPIFHYLGVEFCSLTILQENKIPRLMAEYVVDGHFTIKYFDADRLRKVKQVIRRNNKDLKDDQFDVEGVTHKLGEMLYRSMSKHNANHEGSLDAKDIAQAYIAEQGFINTDDGGLLMWPKTAKELVDGIKSMEGDNGRTSI